jgi:hypothetical protein
MPALHLERRFSQGDLVTALQISDPRDMPSLDSEALDTHGDAKLELLLAKYSNDAHVVLGKDSRGT